MSSPTDHIADALPDDTADGAPGADFDTAANELLSFLRGVGVEDADGVGEWIESGWIYGDGERVAFYVPGQGEVGHGRRDWVVHYLETGVKGPDQHV